MASPRRSSRGLARMFGSDPYAAVQRVLQEAEQALTAAEIKQMIRAAGASGPSKGEWDRLQRRLRTDDHVAVEPGHRYRWVDEPPVPTAEDALDELIRAARSRVKAVHVDIARRTLAEMSEPFEIEARQRQAVMDGLLALVELASEVEELTVAEASPRALIHRVRSRVRLSGLEAIDRAGETVAFDRERHQPLGRPIDDGVPVRVLRPGYVWRSANDEVLVAKPVVQE